MILFFSLLNHRALNDIVLGIKNEDNICIFMLYS